MVSWTTASRIQSLGLYYFSTSIRTLSHMCMICHINFIPQIPSWWQCHVLHRLSLVGVGICTLFLRSNLEIIFLCKTRRQSVGRGEVFTQPSFTLRFGRWNWSPSGWRIWCGHCSVKPLLSNCVRSRLACEKNDDLLYPMRYGVAHPAHLSTCLLVCLPACLLAY